MILCGRDIHPAAELFPMQSPAEYAGTLEDIRMNGQMEPVTVDTDGRIIDGRNRAKACQELGLALKVQTYEGTDVVQYVVSHNLHRRHLTDSQRAMIAERLATRPVGVRNQISDITELPPTQEQAAKLLNVGQSSIQKARTVRNLGTDALAAAVTDGLVPVATGARVAIDLDPERQDEYVERVRAGADPVKSAPKPPGPKPSNLVMPQPPKYGGNRRKHVDQLSALVAAVSGATAAFESVRELDPSVTSEEATRLRGDLSKQIQSLHRINNLMKERITP